MRQGVRKYYESHPGPNAGKVFGPDVRKRVSDGVRKALSEGKMVGGKDKRLGSSNGNAKRVLCVDTWVEYPSAKDAADATGIDKRHIWQNASGGRKDAGGMQWRYLDPPTRQAVMPESYRENKRGIKNGRARPLRCIETGQVYPTGRELSKALGYAASTVSAYMSRGSAIKGLHYEYIDKGELENGISVSESQKNPDED